MRKRAWWWLLQLVVAGVVGALIWVQLVRNWSAYRSLEVTLALRPGWIALSVLLVFVSYAFSVEAWRRVIAGWAQHVPYGRAARIWLVANLGRYVPGKVWSVAGLVVLAQRAGVAPWAAAASAVAIQAIAIGTAIAVVAAATPGAESPWRLAAAALLAVTTIAVLASAKAVRLIARLMGQSADIRPLPILAVAESSALGVLAWVAHGVAFWLLARGLGLPGTLSVVTAAGVFPLGYVLGLLALFAPGGLGVREVVLTSLLAPAFGMGGAVALSLASRVLLTLTEVVAPLVALLVSRHRKEDVSEPA
jgi:uncharacterized membrane protein YbhN (UPF0104 family)